MQLEPEGQIQGFGKSDAFHCHHLQANQPDMKSLILQKYILQANQPSMWTRNFDLKKAT